MGCTSKIIETVLDTAIEKATGELFNVGIKHFDDVTTVVKLRKILKKSVVEYKENEEEINGLNNKVRFEIEDDLFSDLQESLIKPNLTIKQLENNLKDVLSKCIITDDKDKFEKIVKYICSDYKYRVQKYITLYHIDNDIDQLRTMVDDKSKEMKCGLEKNEQATKRVGKDVRELLDIENDRKIENPIRFIDELDDVKSYGYIAIKMLNNDNIDEEDIYNTGYKIGAETRIDKTQDGFKEIIYTFFDMLVQSELRDVLRTINEEFLKNDIKIISIYTHEN